MTIVYMRIQDDNCLYALLDNFYIIYVKII